MQKTQKQVIIADNMADIYKILQELDIKYTKYDHEAVFTVEESKKIETEIFGTHTKNLFLRNKKGNKHWLVIVEGHARADMNKLRKFLDENKLSFASPERLKKYLNLTPGSVTPFGLINDKKHEVIVVIYEDLLEKNDTINFHPNINTTTLNLRVKDFKKFLQWSKNEIKYFIT